MKRVLAAGLVWAVVFMVNEAYADSERIQNQNNGHWYQRIDTSMTWHEAKTCCEDRKGYLATVTAGAGFCI